jgi:hypothetical protein
MRPLLWPPSNKASKRLPESLDKSAVRLHTARIFSAVQHRDSEDSAGLAAAESLIIWSECHQGTNGMGTSLVSGVTAGIHFTDHFSPQNAWLSRISTPVRTLAGPIAGALNVTSPQRAPGAVRVRRQIERFQGAAFFVAGPSGAHGTKVIGAEPERVGLLIGKHTERRSCTEGSGHDPWFGFRCAVRCSGNPTRDKAAYIKGAIGRFADILGKGCVAGKRDDVIRSPWQAATGHDHEVGQRQA